MNIGVTPTKLNVSVVNGGIGVTVSPNPILVQFTVNTGGTSTPTPPGGSNGQIQANVNGSFGGITNTALTALISVFDTTHRGAVPASGNADGLSYLNNAGGFTVPPGTGGGPPTYASRAQIQTAIDAALISGNTVTVNNNVALDGPLMWRAGGVTLNGSGTLSCAAGYVGSLVVVGPATTTAVDSSHRPASVLDNTASSGRTGVATVATHALILCSDGITLGCTNGGMPGYYADLDVLTLEWCVKIPTGVTLAANTGLTGMSQGISGAGFNPDPYALVVSDSPTVWGLSYELTDGTQQLQKFTVDPTLAKNHICWQWNGLAGRNDLWLNGTRVALTGPALPPNSRLKRQSGFSPFGFGFSANFPPLGTPVVNAEFHGFKASGAARYDITKNTQTLLRTNAVPTDQHRYLDWQGGDAPLIGYLPLDDAPASPTVDVAYATGKGRAYWIPVNRAGGGFANQSKVSDLKLVGHAMAPVILTGEQLYTKLRDLQVLGGLLAVATLPVSSSENYSIEISGCVLESAGDAALCFQTQEYTATNITYFGTGYTTVRESNCTSTHKISSVPTPGSYTDSVYEIHGGLCRINDTRSDDEGAGVRTAYVRVFQGFGWAARLVIDGFSVGNSDVPILQLNGISTDFSIGHWARHQIDVKNCSGMLTHVMASVGPDGFRGAFNASGLGSTSVIGTSSVVVSSN